MKKLASCCEDEQNNSEIPVTSPAPSALPDTGIATSMASVAAAAAASRHWYSNKAEMLPFLSLCSRYPGGPWAGLLQQTMKEKQKGMTLYSAVKLAQSYYVSHTIDIPNFYEHFFIP